MTNGRLQDGAREHHTVGRRPSDPQIVFLRDEVKRLTIRNRELEGVINPLWGLDSKELLAMAQSMQREQEAGWKAVGALLERAVKAFR